MGRPMGQARPGRPEARGLKPSPKAHVARAKAKFRVDEAEEGCFWGH
jgi:hypothetical protein